MFGGVGWVWWVSFAVWVVAGLRFWVGFGWFCEDAV